jgi:hypothetical protein
VFARKRHYGVAVFMTSPAADDLIEQVEKAVYRVGDEVGVGYVPVETGETERGPMLHMRFDGTKSQAEDVFARLVPVAHIEGVEGIRVVGDDDTDKWYSPKELLEAAGETESGESPAINGDYVANLAVNLCDAAATEEEIADRALAAGDEKEWAFHSGVHAGVSNVLRTLVQDFNLDLDALAPEVAARSDSWRVEGEG